MANTVSVTTVDQLRMKYGFWAVVVGLVLVAVVFLAAIARWTAASDVTAVVGSITGVVGTVVGAFFGVQVGSAGKEKADAERKIAEDKALRMASALQPDAAATVLSHFET
jgi:hypothetical protein